MIKIKKRLIERIRDLARDYHTAYARPLDAAEIRSDFIHEYFTDPRRKKFKEIVNSLSKEERAELVGLFRLGKENDPFSLEDWNLLLQQAKLEDNNGTADYLIGKVRLAEYINRGLQKMKGQE